MTSERTTKQQLRVQLQQLFPAVDRAGYDRALQAYEHARMDGLCDDGAWECAVDALRMYARQVDEGH